MTAWTRGLTLALALFQAGVPLLAAVADASGPPPGVVRSHIEDHTHRDCPHAHLDDCALCRVQTTFAPPAQSPSAFGLAEPGMPAVLARVADAPAPTSRRLQESRAPPTELT
jgi:hypothetical protein